MTPAVEATALEREFKGGVQAVAGVDLAVAEGEIFGFLGPNGAGKSTTVRILTTLLRPTGGTARVAGHDVVRDASAVRRRIGVALQDAAIDPFMTGRELLHLQAVLHGISRPQGRTRAEAAARPGRPHRCRRPPRRHVLGRHAAAARPRPLARPRAHRAVPRRAHHGTRPALAADGVERGPAPQPRAWNHRLPDDPVPRGGRPARRADRDHRPGPHRRGGHPGPAQGVDRRADVDGDPRPIPSSGTRRRPRLARMGAPLPGSARTVAIRMPNGAGGLAPAVRALDEAGIGSPHLDLAEPSLDDVFLAKTGRSLLTEDDEAAA